MKFVTHIENDKMREYVSCMSSESKNYFLLWLLNHGFTTYKILVKLNPHRRKNENLLHIT